MHNPVMQVQLRDPCHDWTSGRPCSERALETTIWPRSLLCDVQGMLPGVLKGLNATVFAYGATGSGKTHTMVGDAADPGLMVLSMNDIFELIVSGIPCWLCLAC